MSNDLLAHVDARMQVASVDRWQRIKNALTEQPNPIALSGGQGDLPESLIPRLEYESAGGCDYRD